MGLSVQRRGVATTAIGFDLVCEIRYSTGMPATDLVDELEAALAFPNTALIIRGTSTIAEVRGPLCVRRGTEWLTLGEDGGSHVHLRGADIARGRFVAAGGANAMLEVLNPDGAVLCKVSFRHTNPAREDRFDSEFAQRVQARFGHLAD